MLAELAVPVPDWPSWIADAGSRGRAAAGGAARPVLRRHAVRRGDADRRAELGEVRSNIALRPDWALDATLRWPGHLMIDFGDDALTQGRAHPMIDPSLRNRQLAELLADPDTAVVLLDVLLGHGSHPDPVAELLPVLRPARRCRWW